MINEETTKLNDGLDGWIDAEKEKPALINGKDYSVNVWGWDGKSILVVSWFFASAEGWAWANAYGSIWGDAEWDDYYDIKYWKPISIPMPPKVD